MKKIDALMKKVELFERLAVYGDRKSFLQALAQRLVVPNDPNSKPGQGGVHTVDMNAPAAAPASPGPAPLPRVVVPDAGPPGSGGHWADPNQVSDEAPPVDRDPNIMMTKQLNAPAVKEQAAPGKAPAKANPQVLAVQNFLNQQLSQGGAGKASMPPITPDGKWGTETAKALKLWGDKNKLSGVPLTAVFTAIQAQMGANDAMKQMQAVPTPNLDAARRA